MKSTLSLYMKGKPQLHILYIYQLNTYLSVGSVSNNRKKLTKSPISQLATFAYSIPTDFLFLSHFSIFLHETPRITLE